MSEEDFNERIRIAYNAAQESETQARRSPSNSRAYEDAARLFGEAAELSHQSRASASPEAQLLIPAFAEYYRSQQHKALMNLRYHQRDIPAATAGAEQVRNHLSEAIRLGQVACASVALSSEQRSHMQDMVTAWRFQEIAHRAKFASIRARDKWDHDELLDALDLYRRAARDERAALDYLQSHDLDPIYDRITTGNFLAAVVNGSQVLALLALQRARKAGSGPYVPTNLSLEVLDYTYNALEIGQSAMAANPEWDQYREAFNQCRKNIVEFLSDNKGAWLSVYSHFEDRPGFLMIMREVDLAQYKQVEQERHMQQNKVAHLWGIGSFFLLAFAIVVFGLLIVFHNLGFWTGLLALVGIEVAFVLIGAFALRGTEGLSEKNFLSLIGLATKFQIKSVADVLAARKDQGTGQVSKEKSGQDE
jgi:hypothetical protein